MGVFKDLTWQTFGRWTVIERAGNTKGGPTMWLCRCECGAEAVVNGYSLTCGDTTSCGCYRRELLAARSLNLAGQVFGRLRVIEQGGWYTKPGNGERTARWRCQCVCGVEVVVVVGNLKNGHTTSCGCYSRERTGETRFVDLTDRLFGKLTAIKRAGTTKNGGATWLCQCRCGNEAVVSNDNLMSGNTTSCGCAVFNEVYKAVKGRYADYKAGAAKRGIWFTLALETFEAITSQPCHYCKGWSHESEEGRYTGVDRKDSDQGYEASLVVPCCRRCNVRKGTKPYGQFIQELYNERIARVVKGLEHAVYAEELQ